MGAIGDAKGAIGVDAGELISDSHFVTLDEIGSGGYVVQVWYGIAALVPEDEFPYWFDKFSAGKNFMNLELLKRFSVAGIELALPIEVRTASARAGVGPFRLPPSPDR